MLAEQQRVIAGRLGIETTIAAVIGLDVTVPRDVGAIPVRVIVHRLNAAGVAVPTCGSIAKKSGWHMFYRIQPEAVAFGHVKSPHGGAHEIGIYILRHR